MTAPPQTYIQCAIPDHIRANAFSIHRHHCIKFNVRNGRESDTYVHQNALATQLIPVTSPVVEYSGDQTGRSWRFPRPKDSVFFLLFFYLRARARPLPGCPPWRDPTPSTMTSSLDLFYLIPKNARSHRDSFSSAKRGRNEKSCPEMPTPGLGPCHAKRWQIRRSVHLSVGSCRGTICQAGPNRFPRRHVQR